MSIHSSEVYVKDNGAHNTVKDSAEVLFMKRRKHHTDDPRYDDSVCYQTFRCKIEFAVIKKLDMDPSKA